MASNAWLTDKRSHKKNLVAALRRGVKKNRPHATALRRNERLKKNSMTENEIAKHIMDAAFFIHRTHGPGLLETVHEGIF